MHVLAVLLLMAQGPVSDSTLTGNIQKWPAFESKVLSNKRDVWIYLPPGYEKESSRRYPVLYLQDGQNVFDGATSFIKGSEWRVDETAQALIEAGMVEPLIIVGVSNAGAQRADEFLPYPVKMGSSTGGGKAESYLRFLIEEVKQKVDATFRTKTGPTNTGIGGSSFGGIISLFGAQKHASVFGKVMAMSPSLWVVPKGEEVFPMEKMNPQVRLWIDIGKDEGESSRLTETYLKKYRSDRCNGVIESFGNHNEQAWARRFPLALLHLFPAQRQ